jgi:hypothetical protein
MAYDVAEILLLSAKVNKSAFQSFPIATLAKLCEAFGMPVQATGQRPIGSKKKSDFIDAIFTFVRRQSSMW